MKEFVMLIGLPGSGKSTYASKLNGYDIHSSDNIREELNISDPWKEMHKRTKASLKKGRSVIYDATNVSKKKRRQILSDVRAQGAKTIAIVFATPLVECIKRQENRKRKVPIYAINRMAKSFNFPAPNEFDEIRVIQDDFIKIDLNNDIEHDNPYHTLSVKEHMKKAKTLAEKYCATDTKLIFAAGVHDIGKFFTKTYINAKGEKTDIAHYYGHENIGAYYYMTSRIMNDIEIEIVQFINYHMRPYIWEKSEKAERKDRIEFGDEFINRLKKLSRCDREAH